MCKHKEKSTKQTIAYWRAFEIRCGNAFFGAIIDREKNKNRQYVYSITA